MISKEYQFRVVVEKCASFSIICYYIFADRTTAFSTKQHALIRTVHQLFRIIECNRRLDSTFTSYQSDLFK